MDDIDCQCDDDSVLGDDVLKGICDQAGEENSAFVPNDKINAEEHLERGLAPQLVILSNEDSVSGNVSGEQSSEGICHATITETEQTYVFTIDGGSGMIHATPVNIEPAKTMENSDNEDSQSVGQAWFTSKDDKSKLSHGGQWKQGMWSKEEIVLLDENIKNYCVKHSFKNPAEVIFEMTKDARKDFYRTISKGLNRPLFSVYRRVIRMYDKKNHMGRYTSSERTKLKKLYETHGNDWQAIGTQLGRSASSIKDKCRLMKDNCNIGKWFPHEEKLLAEAVYEFSNAQPGEVVSSGISWTQVAERVGTRSEKQCRTKWLNYLNWKHSGGSDWTREDDVRLVTRMCTSQVEDENEIDWTTLAEGWKSVRSPQWLRGKWWNLKRHVANCQTLKFKDVCRQLYAYHVENTKFLGNLMVSENDVIADTISGVELLTPTTTCLTLPHVRFVSIPSVVQIPSNVDVSGGLATETSTMIKSEEAAAASSVALQTFDGNSGTFFITSQGAAIQYPNSALTSASSIILQTLSTDSIHMNVPAQLIIANSSTGDTSEDNSVNIPQFSHALLTGVHGDEIGGLVFDDGEQLEDESDSKNAATVQQSHSGMSGDFILSDPILQGSSTLEDENEVHVLSETIDSEEDAQ